MAQVTRSEFDRISEGLRPLRSSGVVPASGTERPSWGPVSARRAGRATTRGRGLLGGARTAVPSWGLDGMRGAPSAGEYRPIGDVLAGTGETGEDREYPRNAFSRDLLGSVARSLRIADVPAPVIVAIVVLCGVAVACGLYLHARPAGIVYARADPLGLSTAGVAGEVDAGVTVTLPEDAAAAVGADGLAEDGEADSGASAPIMRVHVAGAVACPGVYDLPEGSRVEDAVGAAGGCAPDADAGALNLAAPVGDGAKVWIPRVGEGGAFNDGSEYVTYSDPSSGAAAAPSGPVDINRASAAELTALPGIGEATAAAIVEERTANGPFSSPEDIMRVPGIGKKKYEGLSGQICCT